MKVMVQDVYGMAVPKGEMEYDTSGGGVTYAVLDEGDVLQVHSLYTGCDYNYIIINYNHN